MFCEQCKAKFLQRSPNDPKPRNADADCPCTEAESSFALNATLRVSLGLALLCMATAFPMHLVNHKANKEPNNRYKSASSRQHNLVGLFLPPSQRDTLLLMPHCLQHQSVSSNPQLHNLGQMLPRSRSPAQEYPQSPSPLRTHCYQGQTLGRPCSRSSVPQILVYLMLRSQRNRGRRQNEARCLGLQCLRQPGVRGGAGKRQKGRRWLQRGQDWGWLNYKCNFGCRGRRL